MSFLKKNKMKSIKKNPDAQSCNVQYITEILMKIRNWSRENDGEFVVISSIVYVIVKPYHFFMSCLRMFQGPSCFHYKSDLAMHKSSLCILSARCLKHVSNLDFPSSSCYLFIYLQCIPENSCILTQIALYVQVYELLPKMKLNKTNLNNDTNNIYISKK